MRIYGGSDYIDGMQAYGTDPALVYLRKPKSVTVDVEIGNSYSVGVYSTRVEVQPMVLGFCGQLYPFLRVMDWNTPHFFYNLDEFLASEYASKINGWQWKENLKSHFLRFDRRDDKIFTETADAPTFVLECDKNSHRRAVGQGVGYFARLITNPILKDFGFQKIVDPFTAYQAIATYLGNQLVKEKQPDTIGDEYLIANHGYDKFSFRHPTKLKDLDK